MHFFFETPFGACSSTARRLLQWIGLVHDTFQLYRALYVLWGCGTGDSGGKIEGVHALHVETPFGACGVVSDVF